MGHKKVCFNCRKAFSLYNNGETINLTCPECGSTTVLFNHKFRPPKKTDLKKWRVVEYLKENGFVFQHIYLGKHEVTYPENMDDAKTFVQTYRSQAREL